LASESIDVACISGLLDHMTSPAMVSEEVYRVLKPGGKVLVVAPARYDIDYWQRLLFPWQSWFRPASSEAIEPRRFTARRLRRQFARFIEHRIYKRQLRRSMVPHLWRWLPLGLLERLMGQVLVLKAFKPVDTIKLARLAA